MKYIDVNFSRPYDNFALEEYLLTEAPSDRYLFFYIHRPSIIIGAHQNAHEEINKDYVEAHGITVARRMSGGGAVYHDEGNLNFSFVQPGRRADINDFAAFTKPIVEVLRSLGVPAEMSGRNDIVVDGYKVSGNASCYKNGRILSHGTLLFQANMDALGEALCVHELKLKSKGVQSVRSRVANLSDYLPMGVGVEDLKEAIVDYFRTAEGISFWSPEEPFLNQIRARADAHFAGWDWNWGRSPGYNHRSVGKFPFGLLDVRLTVEQGVIRTAKIYGDFFTTADLAALEETLGGASLHADALQRALAETDLASYFMGMDKEMFIAFLLEDGC